MKRKRRSITPERPVHRFKPSSLYDITFGAFKKYTHTALCQMDDDLWETEQDVRLERDIMIKKSDE